MYATCLHCNRPLGRNEVIEPFPVGRSLAFDPGKGRLWVICTTCRRWNLAPLEERWEAVESCERAFRGLRARVHTDEIGAAAHPEGLRLVRIGEPIPVEFATWRYGESMGERWRRYAFYSAVGTAGGVALSLSGLLGGGFAAGLVMHAPTLIQGLRVSLVRIVVPLPEGRILRVRPLKVELLNPGEEGAMGVRVKHGDEELRLFGSDARRVAARVLPFVNRMGAPTGTVRATVEQMAQVGGPERFLEETWGKARPRPGSGIRWVMSGDMKAGAFGHLPLTTRLGLEMALHEERERRALEGEMAELRAAWREAELIAEISDDLLLPRAIEERLAEMRRQRDGP